MNYKKIFLFFIILVSSLTFVNAIDYTIIEHSIRVQINSGEADKIEERFYLTFSDESSKVSFREKSLEFGTNLDKWKLFNPIFTQSITQNTLNKKISYNEGIQNYLLLSYDLSEEFMAKGKETNMVSEYNLKANYLNSFYQTGLWIIPTNTKLIIDLPPGAEVRETIEPEAIISTQGTRKTVTWQGYKSANKLSLNYVLWKKMDPLFDISELNAFLFRTQTGQLTILAVVILIGFLFWQRKKIVNAIEEFVENNSLIKEE